MSEGMYVAQCAPADVDASGNCTHVVWVQQPDSLSVPPLSASQGFQISGAIAACWAVGFLVRQFRNQARN
jgi:hypothetical protein